MTSVTSGKARGVSGTEGMRGISGFEERKKGERWLQIEEEENEGRIGRNDTMTEGRCDATERGEERAEQDQRVKGGARRLVKAKEMVRHHLPFRFRLPPISLLDATSRAPQLGSDGDGKKQRFRRQVPSVGTRTPGLLCTSRFYCVAPPEDGLSCRQCRVIYVDKRMQEWLPCWRQAVSTLLSGPFLPDRAWWTLRVQWRCPMCKNRRILHRS
jgi:hypothetical protein